MLSFVGYYLLLAVESVVGVFGVRLYEEPSYSVIGYVNERVEIRRYEPSMAAEVALPAGDRKAREQAFRLLFDYISGANRTASCPDLVAMTVPVALEEPKRIAMTVPLQNGREDGMMRFFLAGPIQRHHASRATRQARSDKGATCPRTIAALRYSGTGWNSAAKEAELSKELMGSKWQPIGEAYTLYYDAPFTLPFLRRNEAAVAVTKRPISQQQ